ncbi:arginine decarboxylase, pyruvoyl-dependent [Methanocella sp. CWC-04]|uniref:Pyruvoyl-dependent arginine decarboxylase n=1 Tax=Methanooceanicella nereidis TaxID=2052831 RepID=A0AAP2RE78_9EURY|nr:arginine decarboxylase, pyruvoyl-dependent [Methanocella sp. CWC-04]MCD1295161.1 arginine decarboxylase, pyruvoyl-dependent [Methanocella sp. CWC-04]
MRQALVPKKVFFTCGSGTHKEMLESFEMALRDAGIEKFNLVTVSSILPPKCEILEREEGLKELTPGEIVFTVMSRNCSNEPSRRISASIGCAIPKDQQKNFGYLSEHHSYGETEKYAGMYAEKLAENMLFTWTKEKPEKTMNISKTAEVDDEGNWTTVISAAVFIL